MRVLQWIVERVQGSASGENQVFGVTPRYVDLHWAGLDFTQSSFELATSVDPTEWRAELLLHEQLFRQLAHHLPAELVKTLRRIEVRIDDQDFAVLKAAEGREGRPAPLRPG